MSVRKATLFTSAELSAKILEDTSLGLLHSHAGRLFLALQEIGFVRPEHVPLPGGIHAPQVQKYLDHTCKEYQPVREANRSSKRVEGYMREVSGSDFLTVELAVRWYQRESREPTLTLVFGVYFDTVVTIKFTSACIGAP